MKSKLAWILLSIIVVGWLVYAASSSTFFSYGSESRKDRARMDIRALSSAISRAAEANFNKGTEPPRTLEDALSFIEGSGQSSLLDPWGQPYQFKWVEVEGEQRPVVWTIAPEGELITTARE